MNRIATALCCIILIITNLCYGQSRTDSIHVAHYDLALYIDHINRTISGTATLQVVPKMNGLSYFDLDLKSLTTDAVTINQQSVNYTHTGECLRIQNPSYNPGDTLTVAVTYHGTPYYNSWGGFYFSGNYTFNLGVSMTNVPHCFGRVWYPCIDDFKDKSTYDLHIEVYANHKAVCGGDFLGSEDSETGNYTKIWHWQLKQPVPSYLVSAATGPYQLYTDTLQGLEKNIPITIYHNKNANQVSGSFSHLKTIASNYEQCFGPIPFDRIGYVAVNFTSGAMEHATNIAYPQNDIDGSTFSEMLYAHELSHSWFGNNITCDKAEEMWINEGFACYSEAISQEVLYGQTAYAADIANKQYTVLEEMQDDGGYFALNQLPQSCTYGTHAYEKGATIVHNLRQYLGDSLFFGGIKALMQEYKYQNINSEQMFDLLSNYCGINLDGFYEGWVNQPGYLHFSIDSIVPEGGNMYGVYVRQRLFHANHFADDNRIALSFFGSNGQRYDYSDFVFSGEYGIAHLSIPFEPQYGVADFDNDICDAEMDYHKTCNNAGSITSSTLNMTMNVNSITDSSKVCLEYHYVPADPFKTEPATHYRLNSRYWRVEYTDPSNVTASGSFKYDASSASKPDYALLQGLSVEDLVMLYRRNCADDWHFIEFTRSGCSSGILNVATLLPGEYTLAAKRPCLKIRSQKNRKVSVFPNPTHSQIKLECTEQMGHIRVYDPNGREVLSLYAGDCTATLNVSNLSKGSYILHVYNRSNLLITNKQIVKI